MARALVTKLRIPDTAAQTRKSPVARSGPAEASCHDISNTWLAHGYSSSSLTTPARQSSLHQLRCEPGTRSFDMSDGHQKAPRPTWLLDRGCPDSLFQHACAPGDLRHDRAGIAPQIPC